MMIVMETPQQCRLIKVSGWNVDEVGTPPLQVSTLSLPVRSLVIGDDVQKHAAHLVQREQRRTVCDKNNVAAA